MSTQAVNAGTEKFTGVISETETCVNGRWFRVPVLQVASDSLIVRGRWLKVAVVLDEDWLVSEISDPDLCVRALQERSSGNLHADIFTFVQKPPATTPRYDFRWEWESIAVVSTRRFKDWWEKVPQETRKNVRRAQKRGVDVRVCKLDDQMVKGLVELHNDSRFRQGKVYTHYGKTFEQVKKDQSTFLDRSEFIGAFLGEELIGFLKLVYRGQIASILQFLPKSSHNDKRPANALLAKAIEVCEAKGMRYLTYGLFSYGNKRDCPLREFKIRNGFAEMLIPRFYIPLTAKGQICIKLKLHRGLLGILPENMISLGVGARNAWHNLTQSLRRHSLVVERQRS